jgi:hypothetical protein
MTTLGHTPRFTISITREVLERMIASNSNHCAIAEAVKEAYPHLTHIAVDIQTIRATDKNKKERYVWLTPRRGQTLIIDVDQGRKDQIRPFKMMLRDGQTIRSGHGARAESRKPSKLRRPKNGNHQSAPVRVGGKAPPRMVGQRRQFGLRAMEF